MTAAAAATPVRIMIVDDDPYAANTLSAALAAEGFDPFVVETVGAALIRLELGLLPQVVILDLQMPDASGALVLGRIRRDNLAIKVAIAMALPDPGASLDVSRNAPDVVFHKPVDLPKLVEWLNAGSCAR